MPRPVLTPDQRAVNVAHAVNALPQFCEIARAALATFGPTDARTLAAWADVENLGATVHRQSRLLAGKSKGG